MPETRLTVEKVSELFRDSLFKDGEDTSDYIAAPGIITNVGFHPQRLESHRVEIESLLAELPPQFHQSTGGGWSFLAACNDRHGHQWTGAHMIMEQLFQLGIGIGKVKLLMPQAIWTALPGGVPYYVILNKPEKANAKTRR